MRTLYLVVVKYFGNAVFQKGYGSIGGSVLVDLAQIGGTSESWYLIVDVHDDYRHFRLHRLRRLRQHAF